MSPLKGDQKKGLKVSEDGRKETVKLLLKRNRIRYRTLSGYYLES